MQDGALCWALAAAGKVSPDLLLSWDTPLSIDDVDRIGIAHAILNPPPKGS